MLYFAKFQKRKSMIISIIQKKGGVGKTPLAFSLAKDLGLCYRSNDISLVPQFFLGAKIEKQCSFEPNCVYDFGGFVSADVIDIARKSDYIFIPVTPNPNSIFRGMETIQELRPALSSKTKLVILLTDIANQTELDDMAEQIKKFQIDLAGVEFFVLKKSKIFQNAILCGMSFLELENENALAKNQYRSFIDQYQKILNFIKK